MYGTTIVVPYETANPNVLIGTTKSEFIDVHSKFYVTGDYGLNEKQN